MKKPRLLKLISLPLKEKTAERLDFSPSIDVNYLINSWEEINL